MTEGQKRMLAARACGAIEEACRQAAPKTEIGQAIATMARHALVKALEAGKLDALAEIIIRAAAADGVDLLAVADGLFARK